MISRCCARGAAVSCDRSSERSAAPLYAFCRVFGPFGPGCSAGSRWWSWCSARPGCPFVLGPCRSAGVLPFRSSVRGPQWFDAPYRRSSRRVPRSRAAVFRGKSGGAESRGGMDGRVSSSALRSATYRIFRGRNATAHAQVAPGSLASRSASASPAGTSMRTGTPTKRANTCGTTPCDRLMGTAAPHRQVSFRRSTTRPPPPPPGWHDSCGGSGGVGMAR